MPYPICIVNSFVRKISIIGINPRQRQQSFLIDAKDKLESVKRRVKRNLKLCVHQLIGT